LVGLWGTPEAPHHLVEHVIRALVDAPKNDCAIAWQRHNQATWDIVTNVGRLRALGDSFALHPKEEARVIAQAPILSKRDVGILRVRRGASSL